MRRVVLALALSLVPVVVSGAPVSVDVRVAGGLGWSSGSWIEFRPDHGAYVAVYATFSDGSVHRVFPVAGVESHWVDGRETRAIPVCVPRGTCLTNVQAVASREWFDPAERWIASAPRAGRRTHRVVNAGSWVVRRQPAWGFVVGWAGSSAEKVARTGRVENGSGDIAYASSGAYSSVRRRGSGEPVRRSGR